MALDKKILDKVAEIARSYTEIKKVALFGSRSRGDNSPTSDIDLAIYLRRDTFAMRNRFYDEIDEIDTLYKFDIVVADSFLDSAMLRNIERDGIIIMECNTKIANYLMAVDRLNEALAEGGETPTALNRDGIIKRFEFVSELAWKSLREYLTDMGYAEINSPKSVMKEAFAYGILSSSEGWIDILNDRNTTAHIYKESEANEVFQRIRNAHSMLFNELKSLYETADGEKTTAM